MRCWLWAKVSSGGCPLRRRDRFIRRGCLRAALRPTGARRLNVRERLTLSIFDQVLSSASNVLVIFAVAGVSSVEEFGAVSLAFAALTTVMAMGRGLLGTPIALLSGDPDKLRSETPHALGAAVWAGVCASGLIALMATLTRAPMSTYLLAVAAPMVLVQDTSRYFCISSGHPKRAVLSDGIWALGSAVLLLATWIGPEGMDIGSLLGVWACLTMVAMLAILLPLRLLPRFTGLLAWWRSEVRDRLRFGAEGLIGATSSFLVLGIVTAIIGTTATAALRGAGTVLGPLSILMSAIPLAMVPELRRRGKPSVASVWRPLRNLAIPMSAFAIAIGAIALAVPQAWGELILGDSWTVVRPLLPITATEYAALAWLAAARGGIRALGRSSDLLILQLVFAGSSIAFGSLAAIVSGSIRMVAIALSIAAVVAAAYARFWLFRIPPTARSTEAGSADPIGRGSGS